MRWPADGAERYATIAGPNATTSAAGARIATGEVFVSDGRAGPHRTRRAHRWLDETSPHTGLPFGTAFVSHHNRIRSETGIDNQAIRERCQKIVDLRELILIVVRLSRKECLLAAGRTQVERFHARDARMEARNEKRRTACPRCGRGDRGRRPGDARTVAAPRRVRHAGGPARGGGSACPHRSRSGPARHPRGVGPRSSARLGAPGPRFDADGICSFERSRAPIAACFAGRLRSLRASGGASRRPRRSPPNPRSAAAARAGLGDGETHRGAARRAHRPLAPSRSRPGHPRARSTPCALGAVQLRPDPGLNPWRYRSALATRAAALLDPPLDARPGLRPRPDSRPPPDPPCPPAPPPPAARPRCLRRSAGRLAHGDGVLIATPHAAPVLFRADHRRLVPGPPRRRRNGPGEAAHRGGSPRSSRVHNDSARNPGARSTALARIRSPAGSLPAHWQFNSIHLELAICAEHALSVTSFAAARWGGDGHAGRPDHAELEGKWRGNKRTCDHQRVPIIAGVIGVYNFVTPRAPAPPRRRRRELGWHSQHDLDANVRGPAGMCSTCPPPSTVWCEKLAPSAAFQIGGADRVLRGGG